jgi:hypothetical protein
MILRIAIGVSSGNSAAARKNAGRSNSWDYKMLNSPKRVLFFNSFLSLPRATFVVAPTVKEKRFELLLLNILGEGWHNVQHSGRRGEANQNTKKQGITHLACMLILYLHGMCISRTVKPRSVMVGWSLLYWDFTTLYFVAYVGAPVPVHLMEGP